MKTHFIYFLFYVVTTVCTAQEYNTENLKVERLTENVYQHTSYLEISGYGRYPCNGMIYFNEGEAVIFDTPVDTIASGKLIAWILNDRKTNINAVVVTHFHVDCLGGLSEFHEQGIPSYANKLTLDLAKQNNEVLPEHTFENELRLAVGEQTAILKYFGKGHTQDNIVAYIPSEKVLFGGCLIKEQGAGKGNLADASSADWAQTVSQIKTTWPGVQKVIPGHGAAGSAELLDYTMKLFEER